MKKLYIVLSLLVIIVVVGISLYFFFLKPLKKPQMLPTMNQASIQEHNKVYADPSAIHIRNVLDSYLQNKLIGTSDPNILINGDPKIDKAMFLLTGLKKFSSDYYKSKFIVLNILPYSKGGKFINIEFVDKQDKIFTAIVYPTNNNSYDLHYFGQNLQFSQTKIEMINSRYSFMLHDTSHTL